jgi:hypothetical protein
MDSVTICNLALAHIGDQSIVSMTDPSQEARFCTLFYNPVRQEILRQHPWNFATKIVQLNQTVTPPIFDWTYKYQLPTDFFRLITVNAFGVSQPSQTYEIQGDFLLSDIEAAAISYTADVTDENLFDSIFVEVFCLRLAARLAKSLAGSMQISQQLNQEYKYLLSEARRIDGTENSERQKYPWVNSDLVKARYIG